MENKNPNPRPAQAGKYGDSAALADSRQAPTKKTPEGLLNDLGFEKVESDSVWKFVRDDAVIRVDSYEDPPSPRDDDGNVGIIALYPGCDYDFADERLDEVPDDAIVSLPIYAYVHGGIVLGFADNDFPDRQWDVGPHRVHVHHEGAHRQGGRHEDDESGDTERLSGRAR